MASSYHEYTNIANEKICSTLIGSRQDFYLKLTQNETLGSSGVGDRYYERSTEEFVREQRIPIPQDLLIDMQNIRSHFTMGLFSEIKQAYVTIDCDLFMWNYETNCDLRIFDAIEHTIIKLALAKPKAGVFQSHIAYLVVVGTVSNVQLYGLSIVNGEMAILPQPLFKVDLEATELTSIVTTDKGRIFFSAKDILYEFDYQVGYRNPGRVRQDKGWFSRTCKKINRSATFLDSLTSLIMTTAEDIDDVVIDSSRNILYVLTKKNSIQVYDLGANGDQCTRVTSAAIGQLRSQAIQLTQGQHEPSFFSHIVALSPITAAQSHHINLVATTTKGVRLYFSCQQKQPPVPQGYATQVQSREMSEQESRPFCLRLVHVRFMPGVCPPSVYRDAPQGVYASYCNNSLCVMSTVGRENVFLSSDLYFPSSRHYLETLNEIKVDGHIWAITVDCEKYTSDPPPQPGMTPSVLPHPFYLQHTRSPEKIILLTNEAIHIVSHRSPLDAMRAALADRGADMVETSRLCQQLGHLDSMVLAIAILASDAAIDLPLKDKAVHVFFGWKDEPEMVDVDTRNLSHWSSGDNSIAEWQIRSPLLSSTPYPDSRAVSTPHYMPSPEPSVPQGGMIQWKGSKRYEALYAYFTRLVAPLWQHAVAVASGKDLLPCYSPKDLDFYAKELRKFSTAMTTYGLVPKTLQSRGDMSLRAKNNEDAAKRERDFLVALQSIVNLTAETLSLWSIAIGLGLPAVTMNMESGTVEKLSNRRMCELATQPQFNSALIKALIGYFLGDEGGTRELSDRLRAACPTLYSKEDALVTTALEYLERASTEASNRRRLIEQAVDLLKQSILKVSLKDVCAKLINLKAYESVVSLCVLRAARDDPKQLALIAYRKKSDGDREAAECAAKRNEAYAVITGMLDQIHETVGGSIQGDKQLNMDLIVKTVINTEDELAHCAIFRWLLSRGDPNSVLQSESRFVESWLNHEISGGGGHRYLDLLWRFYEKVGALGKAAALLDSLASTDRPEVTLTQRFSYLSHGIMCAQAAGDAEAKNLIPTMRDKLEVAQIQISLKEALASLADGAAVARELDGELLPLQDLCIRYAIPFNLHTIQLDIFRCANFYDQQKVHDLWEDIIKTELSRAGDESSLSSTLLATLSDLEAKFCPSNYFPTEFIVVTLLARALEFHIGPEFFISFINKLHISVSSFLQMIVDEYRRDPFWRENGRAKEYIVEVVTVVTEFFLNTPTRYSQQDRSSLSSKCESLLSSFVVEIRSLQATPSRTLPALQQRLEMSLKRLAQT